MRITIDCTPEEARNFPRQLGLTKNVDELAEEAVIGQRNIQTLRRFQEEVFNGRDWSDETLAKYLTEDFIDHTYRSGDVAGHEGFRARAMGWQAAFSESVQENVSVTCEGELVAVLYDLKARHTGEFMGIEPSNRPIVIPGLEILRFRDGKIAERWTIYDYLSTAEEIGANITFTTRSLPGGATLTEAAGTYGAA
jgi:predicted ester cyclase